MSINTSAIKNTFLNFLVPIVCLVVSTALGLIIIYPSINSLPVLSSEVENKRQLNQQLDTKIISLNKLSDFKSVVEENEELISKVLVSEPDVPELLTQIDTIVKESGLEVTKLSYSFGSTTGSASTEESSSYELVSVSLSVHGNYSQIQAFLTNLENSARIVDVESFRYSTTEAEGAAVLDVSFVLISPYLFVESSAVTDEPVNLDVTSPDFIALINKIKSLKLYTPGINEQVQQLATEESPTSEEESETEESKEEPEGPPTP